MVENEHLREAENAVKTFSQYDTAKRGGNCVLDTETGKWTEINRVC